jgi:hypothetical protein
MRFIHDSSWTRRGFTLLWGTEALASVATPEQVISLRALFGFGTTWPEDFPGGGDTLVVAGLEPCLDALPPEQVDAWLEQSLRPRLLGFQEQYQNGAALVLWLPSARRRLKMSPSDESYHWRGITPGRPEIPVGRTLFSGAEADLARLINPNAQHKDSDGDAWFGLHLPRIS